MQHHNYMSPTVTCRPQSPRVSLCSRRSCSWRSSQVHSGKETEQVWDADDERGDGGGAEVSSSRRRPARCTFFIVFHCMRMKRRSLRDASFKLHMFSFQNGSFTTKWIFVQTPTQQHWCALKVKCNIVDEALESSAAQFYSPHSSVDSTHMLMWWRHEEEMVTGIIWFFGFDVDDEDQFYDTEQHSMMQNQTIFHNTIRFNTKQYNTTTYDTIQHDMMS